MAQTNVQAFSGDVAISSNLAVDTNTLFVDSVGNKVGIGTASPSSVFTSYGGELWDGSDHTSKVCATLQVTRGGGVGAQAEDAGTGAILKFRHGVAPDSFRHITIESVSEGVYSAKIGLRFKTTPSSSGPQERMRIDGNGNVGIGTANPDGKIHVYNANPTNYTGITNGSADVKTVISNDNLGGTNGSTIQVYRSVGSRIPSAIDFHSETGFQGSNVYTLSLNPRGGRIGLNDLNPDSDLTMGARIYNTTGYAGLVGDASNPVVYKGDPNNTTVTLPYTQYSTGNPATGYAYYFVNPYRGQEAQCTIVYDNAQTSANGLIYFYCNGTGHQPNTLLSISSSGNSEFTIPLLETGASRGNRINAIHMKPINGTQIRIVAVYWVPYRGVTANIKDGGKLVLGTVGGFGTPGAALSFRREYETPTGNQLEPTQRLDNGIAWMTDLTTGHNSALGGNGIDWSKNNNSFGVSVGARIWYQPGSFTSVSSGAAGNHGRLNLSAGYSTGQSNTPVLTITSSGRVGIGTTNPGQKLDVNGYIKQNNTYFFVSDTTTTFTSAQSFGNVEHIDRGGNWSTTTKRFTAPVKGLYIFTFNGFTINEEHYGIGYNNDNPDIGSYHTKTLWSIHGGTGGSHSWMLELNANDFIALRLYNSGNLYPNRCYFMGGLLYAV